MTEQDLRQLVRDVITSRAAHAAAPRGGAHAMDMAGVRRHPSHAMFVLPSDPYADGRCIVEPAVMCTHCGFCKSWGA